MLKLSFTCYLLVAIGSIVFGFIYLLRKKFMPYHQLALNKQWEELESEYQTLILALMRVTGSGFLATGVTILLLFLIYFQTEELITLWIIPAIATITSVGSLYATILVKTKTAGNPPIRLSILSIVLIILGTVFLARYSLIAQ
jgi:hypothetical protein